MLEVAIPAIWASVHSWFSPAVLFVLLNLVIGTIAVTSKGGGARHSDAAADNGVPRKLARSPSAVLDRLRSFKLSRQPSLDVAAAVPTPPDHPDADEDTTRKLVRTPSSVFDNLRSFGLPHQPPLDVHAAPPPADEGATRKLARTPSAVFDRLCTFKLYRQPSLEVVAAPPTSATVEIHEVEVEEHVHYRRSQSDAQPTAGEMPPKLAGKLKKSASSKSAFAHFAVADVMPRGGAAVEEEEEEVQEVDARADDFISRFRQQLQLQRMDSIQRYKDLLHRGV